MSHLEDVVNEAGVELVVDPVNSSCEAEAGFESSSESLKLELSESVGVFSSSLSQKKDEESEGQGSPSLPWKRTHISPSDSETEEIESKKMKLSMDEAQRRKSVQVIKVVNKTSDLDVSVIDLISDKDYSSNAEATTNEGKSLDEEDLFSDSPSSKQNTDTKMELSTCIKRQDHCTPVNEKPKSVVSSVEFNEKETYSSTPNVPSTKNIPYKRLHDAQQNKSESATEELPKDNVYFVQINDLSILKGIKNISGIGPIYKASHAPDPSFLKDVLEWEKTDIKTLVHSSKSGRVSDASSLSTISSKVSSTGYSADQSSAGSGLSENNKRDRISIAPEATIPHHKVIAKLPVFKNTPKVILEDLTSISHLENDKLDATSTKKKSLRKTKLKRSKFIASPDKSLTEKTSNDSVIHIGLDVFAKWAEGKREARYYLGKVTEEAASEDHKWKILFHDGIEKVLKESELISSESLVPGTYVNVEVDKNCIRRAIIISHPIPNEESICYSVEFEADNDESVEQSSLVPISKLHLDMKQVKEMASEVSQFRKDELSSRTGGDLDLNNIVFTKRTRPSRFPVTPSKSQKKGGKYVDTSTAETSCSETPKSSVASKKKASTSKVKTKMVKSTTETEDDECSSPSLRKKGRKIRKIDSTSLFRKMNFILTKTNTKHPTYGLDTETDLGDESTSSDDNDDKEKMKVDPFNKYEIKSLILKHGGVVLNSFPGENSKFPKKEEELYIVSDKSCRTLNFLYGIAHGVPPISFQWILDSVRGTKKFPIANYLLPLGYSETEGFEIEQGACESRSLFKLLDKLKILVFGKAAEDWKVFLVRLGAKVYSQKTETLSCLSKHVLNKINVALMTDDEDNQHVPDILSNITVVSPRWIIQSLINRKKLDFDLFIVK